jgi:hypothetical protein
MVGAQDSSPGRPLREWLTTLSVSLGYLDSYQKSRIRRYVGRVKGRLTKFLLSEDIGRIVGFSDIR